jgi:hypothetical protein
MKIEQTHQIDCSERGADGKYDWYYEYDIYRFTQDDRTLVARSYKDTIEEAHFLRLEVQAKSVEITAKNMSEPLFKQALLHLRSIGKMKVEYLGPEGYAPIATEA